MLCLFPAKLRASQAHQPSSGGEDILLGGLSSHSEARCVTSQRSCGRNPWTPPSQAEAVPRTPESPRPQGKAQEEGGRQSRSCLSSSRLWIYKLHHCLPLGQKELDL